MLEKFLDKTEFVPYMDFMPTSMSNASTTSISGYDVVGRACREPDKTALLWTNDRERRYSSHLLLSSARATAGGIDLPVAGIGRGDMVTLIPSATTSFGLIVASTSLGPR